jgi:hypothetical protein
MYRLLKVKDAVPESFVVDDGTPLDTDPCESFTAEQFRFDMGQQGMPVAEIEKAIADARASNDAKTFSD